MADCVVDDAPHAGGSVSVVIGRGDRIDDVAVLDEILPDDDDPGRFGDAAQPHHGDAVVDDLDRHEPGMIAIVDDPDAEFAAV